MREKGLKRTWWIYKTPCENIRLTGNVLTGILFIPLNYVSYETTKKTVFLYFSFSYILKEIIAHYERQFNC